MAEVEAICAKLQNKPIANKDDKDPNCVFFPSSSLHMEGPCDDLNSRRRKRKTNAPKSIGYKDSSNDDQLRFDQSCGALDLRLNQRTLTDPTELNGHPDSDYELKPRMTLPTFLQAPLMNIFMKSREHMDNFKYLNQPPLQSSIFSQQTNSQSSTDSDSKSEDDSKEAHVLNIPDSDRKINFSNVSISSNHTDKGFANKVENSQQSYTEMEEECIKRFSSYEDCKDEQCQKDLLRDHFHCIQCKKTILRREEMIRHSKWHKKREESLQFNFMRFSPNDDCNEYMCTYNGRQTHYHCLHSGCNKIYISTSDVQMHSNFHKKDAAINQEGFQRYRATEFCSVSSCSYHNQRTTHFHCMRPNCKFTFKNKADMDKHKSHHQRNDSLSKEGFKKYIKYEHCDFNGCKFSKLMNHIHCIRSNCDYVVHSSAQINSHRRKHERRVLSNGIIITPQEFKSDYSILNLSKNVKSPNSDETITVSRDYENDIHTSSPNNEMNQNSELLLSIINDVNYWENASEWLQEVRKFSANNICVPQCSLPFKDHFHCLFPNCHVSFKRKEKIIDHCRRHKIDNALQTHCYQSCSEQTHLTVESQTASLHHFHCKWTNCSYIRTGPDTKPESGIDFNFLQDLYDHFDSHESKFHCFVINKTTNKEIVNPGSNESNEESDIYQFNIDPEKPESYYINGERKRGRPPKYKKNVQIPKIELNEEDIHDDESISDLTRQHFSDGSNGIKCGFKFYSASNVFCLDDLCMYYGRSEHYHCLRFRCNHTTDSITAVNLHRREFHHYMQIDDGYEYFDRSVNCRRNQCQNNRVNNHYHCVRHNCDYSFKRFNTMHQHTKKHLDLEKHKSGSGQLLDDQPFNPIAISSATTTLSSSTAPLVSNDYSTTPNGMFPFPNNSNDPIFYRSPQDSLPLPIIPSLSNNSSISLPPNMNLNLFMNFNNSLSNFHNTIKALMNNNTNCYSMFPPASKMPRLQLE